MLDIACSITFSAPPNAASTQRIYGLYDVERRKRAFPLVAAVSVTAGLFRIGSSIMNMYDFVKKQIEGDTEMAEIKNSLSRMSDDIYKLGLEVRDGIANLKLCEPERKILNCIRDLELLIESPANPDFTRDVNNNCGLHLENSLDAIADSLNGVGVHSSDLLQVTYDNVDVSYLHIVFCLAFFILLFLTK